MPASGSARPSRHRRRGAERRVMLSRAARAAARSCLRSDSASARTRSSAAPRLEQPPRPVRSPAARSLRCRSRSCPHVRRITALRAAAIEPHHRARSTCSSPSIEGARAAAMRALVARMQMERRGARLRRRAPSAPRASAIAQSRSPPCSSPAAADCVGSGSKAMARANMAALAAHRRSGCRYSRRHRRTPSRACSRPAIGEDLGQRRDLVALPAAAAHRASAPIARSPDRRRTSPFVGRQYDQVAARRERIEHGFAHAALPSSTAPVSAAAMSRSADGGRHVAPLRRWQLTVESPGALQSLRSGQPALSAGRI